MQGRGVLERYPPLVLVQRAADNGRLAASNDQYQLY